MAYTKKIICLFKFKFEFNIGPFRLTFLILYGNLLGVMSNINLKMNMLVNSYYLIKHSHGLGEQSLCDVTEPRLE